MTGTETPAEFMRRAARRLDDLAKAATPGPWERPLDTRHKDAVIAALPDGEEGSYLDGMIPAAFASHSGLAGRYAGQRERVAVVSASTWSIGGFARKRSGRDLEYIALVDPRVGRALAVLLNEAASAWESGEPWWGSSLAIARVILDEPGGGVT